MTTERVRALDRFWESVNNRDLDAAVELYSEDAVISLAGRELAGRVAIKAELGGFVSGFPDITFRASKRWSSGDFVFEEWEARGTNRGNFLGFSPTNAAIRLEAMTIYRFRGDRVISDRTYMDMTRVLLATGAVRATPRC